MAHSYRTNVSNIAAHYLQRLQIPITKTSLWQALEQNPYYPSLYSISNTFDKFNIENAAFEATAENLDQLQPPFAAYLNGQKTGKDFVLVTAMARNTISYIAEGNKINSISKEDFIKQWQKIVLIAEGNAASGEADYADKLKKERNKVIKSRLLYIGIAFLIGLLSISFISSTNRIIAASAITLIKLLGVATTILLLVYDIDKTNSFVKNICTAGKQTNCDAVLNSKASKIFGMGWGEVGFFYFAATTTFLLLPGLAFANKLPWLAIANAVAAPYIVFSIYYQWKVVKQWCPLCLTVQAILALELIWNISYFWLSAISSSQSLAQSIAQSILSPFPLGRIGWAVLFPFIIWYLLKPLLLKAKDAPLFENAYKRLLYNPDNFNTLLQQQQFAPDGWQNLGINIGNPNATNTIIKVCNPYCGPCAKAHPVLEEIIKHNKDVQVKVIFTATNNENDRGNIPVKHLLAIAAKGDAQLTEQALDDWYLAEKREYKTFAAKYKMFTGMQEEEAKIDLMDKWCTDAEVRATPTIFINGRRLPQTYSINELKNIF